MKSSDYAGKKLAYILRHKPDEYGITLDEEGWAPVGLVLKALALNRDELTALVEADSKGRYSFSPDGLSIRANQGHSISTVQIEYEERVPPARLFHGTATRFLPDIEVAGLKPMSRLYVHLTESQETALETGKRHGAGVVLIIDASAAHEAGHKFYVTPNGVWHVKHLPPQFFARAA